MSVHVQRLLAQAREGDLAADERARVDAHLIACEACRSFDTAVRRNDASLSEREVVSGLPALPVRVAKPLPRLVGFGSIAVATILLGLTVGAALGQWREDRSNQSALQTQAARTPQASAARIPRGLILAPGSPSSGFGLLSTQGNELLVRSEPSANPRIVLQNALPNVAVAPNGRSIAVWLRGGVTNNQFEWSLHILDAIDGNMGPGLLATTDELPYGSPRWSSDGSGIIVGTQTPVFRGLQRPGGSTHNTWFAIDLSTQSVNRLGTLEASLATVVYAWDRQRDLITAAGVVANADLLTYVVVRAGTAEIYTLPPRSAISAADAYAGSLVVGALAACPGQASLGECVHLEIHDPATFSTVTTLPPSPTSAQRLLGVVFRPRSQDLIVSLLEPNGTVRDELWSDLGRGSHRVLATSTGAADRGAITGVIPRADGSAVFILRFDPSGTGRWYGTLASLSDTTQTPFEIGTGGNPLASVVLDPAFARELEN